MPAALQSCTVRACPPLKLLHATLHATVVEVESAPTSATSHATVSSRVHDLQHCAQLRDATLRAMMHRVSVPQVN